MIRFDMIITTSANMGFGLSLLINEILSSSSTELKLFKIRLEKVTKVVFFIKCELQNNAKAGELKLFRPQV